MPSAKVNAIRAYMEAQRTPGTPKCAEAVRKAEVEYEKVEKVRRAVMAADEKTLRTALLLLVPSYPVEIGGVLRSAAKTKDA